MHSSKLLLSHQTLELKKLAEVFKTKGLKILQNVDLLIKNMLSPTKRVLCEYHVLVVCMFQKQDLLQSRKTLKVFLTLTSCLHYII